MFKLKKILNSATTVPELVRRKASNTEKYTCGYLLKMSDDGVVKNVKEGEFPTHVCCESLAAGERKDVLCYEILDTMIFSAAAYDNMTDVVPGVKVVLEANEKGYYTLVSSNDIEGYVTLYSTVGATQSGDTVLVRFIK